MVRVDFFLLGYRKISFPEESAKDIANLLLKNRISAKISDNSYILIKNLDYVRIKDQLDFLGASASDLYGLVSCFKNFIRARGVIFGLVPVIFMLAFSSGVVWDIRVMGEEVPREVVIEELRSHGFFIGRNWSGVDRSQIENAILMSSDNISWININRRGSVAYVSAVPKISREDSIEDGKYSNIVAEYDCIIDEITVISGYAEVSKGDAVSKGDLLISGVIPEEAGGGFCRASGVVLGRINREISVSVDKDERILESEAPALCDISLQIFDFSLNIFKKYGNVMQGCDIIKDVEDLIVFGKYRLPVSIIKKYAVSYTESEADYSDDELVRIASSRLMTLIKTEMYSADVVAIRTDGAFSDTGYTASSKLTVIVDFAQELEFSAE